MDQRPGWKQVALESAEKAVFLMVCIVIVYAVFGIGCGFVRGIVRIFTGLKI